MSYITREELLGMKAAHDEKVKQQHIKNQVTRLRTEVMNAALQGKTEFTVPSYTCDSLQHFAETVAAIQDMFPDSRVESNEQEFHKWENRGTIKIDTIQIVRSIKIDWS